jgi:hypothetical protein
MKTITLFTFLSMTLSSFAPHSAIDPSQEAIAKQAIAALRHSSLPEYQALFPSLADFHEEMEKNVALYGDFLPEAKAEFAKQYGLLEEQLTTSFTALEKDGRKKGIDWDKIQYAGMQSDDHSQELSIRFLSGGKEFRIQIEKIWKINGEWKISQFASLK